MNRHKFAKQMGRIEHECGHSTKAKRHVLQRLVQEAGAAYVISKGKIMGYRLPDGSLICKKRRYRNKVAADVDLARIRHVSLQKHIPVRSYACPDCKGFHLTSVETNELKVSESSEVAQ